ncbi:MAG: transcription antitermination factor NusB [Lactobacillaceae bacterium]|jgi:N utilization substance protein B|nr:transcription antitermination factor NusB [Lactobacillaceae bacterium]
MATLNRHQLRQAALQSMFSLGMNSDAKIEVVVEQVLAGDPEIQWDGELPSELIELIQAVTAHIDEFDLLIANNLATGWTLDRLNLLDVVIIRLALYEAKYGDVPVKVAVDEAVNLAKDFSDDKSGKFVNGILSKVLTFE